MRINNLLDIFIVIDELYRYLRDKDITFDKTGLPIYRKEMFLTEWPELIIPYSQRKNRMVSDRSRTVLCFFDGDQRLYPRIGKLLDEIDEYRSFMGVIGLDVTITDDMDEEWQQAMFLLNHLFLSVLAINDIKIIINTRTGSINPYTAFANVPEGIMVASGFLGCDKLEEEYDYSYLAKVLTLMPEKLIIYGKHDSLVEKQLDAMGISYRVYTDFHRLCKEVRHGR